MPQYTACIAYNAPYYATIEFEAEDDAAAIKHAKEAARECDGDYDAQIELADELRVVDVTRVSDDEIIAESLDASDNDAEPVELDPLAAVAPELLALLQQGIEACEPEWRGDTEPAWMQNARALIKKLNA